MDNFWKNWVSFKYNPLPPNVEQSKMFNGFIQISPGKSFRNIYQISTKGQKAGTPKIKCRRWGQGKVTHKTVTGLSTCNKNFVMQNIWEANG